MMMMKSIMMMVMALLWFPANRIISGQVPGVLVAQAEIIQIGKSSYSHFCQIQFGKNTQNQNVKEDWLI